MAALNTKPVSTPVGYQKPDIDLTVSPDDVPSNWMRVEAPALAK
jgi:hypothetical protein